MKTYGTISLDRAARAWTIECEPHVALRLKRVFAKLAKSSHGKHRISDTVENGHDLEWFLDRYPVSISKEDLRHLRARADEYRSRADLIAAITSGKAPPSGVGDLAVPLREYQKVAAAVVLASRSLLLADELGLGKTASAIGTFSDPRTLPALVVTMTHLPRQWQAEIRRFVPNLRVHVIQQGQPYDLTLGPAGRACQFRHRWVADKLAPGGLRCSRCTISREDVNRGHTTAPFPDVVVTSYSKLSAWAETLGGLGFKSVCFDEVQELRGGKGARPKNEISAKWWAAEHIASRCEFRLGLSATPIYNYGSEFYSVFSILRPHDLGEWDEFREEWCKQVGQSNWAIREPKAFGTYVRESGLMLRRTRVEVGRELPAITRVPQQVECDPKALDAVGDACAELARTILGQNSGRGVAMQASAQLDAILRQATGVAKAPYVAAFVRLLVEAGEKVVVFAWHREVYAVLLEALRSLSPVMYTGSESPQAKQAARERFLDTSENGSPILLMSLRSGAGLDGLQQVSSVCVFAELDWSPGVHNQCEGRVDRDGQPRPVVAYYLTADEGSDPTVMDVLQRKRQQLDGAVNPDAELVQALEADPNHVRKLAAAYLAKRGESVPAESEVA